MDEKYEGCTWGASDNAVKKLQQYLKHLSAGKSGVAMHFDHNGTHMKDYDEWIKPSSTSPKSVADWQKLMGEKEEAFKTAKGEWQMIQEEHPGSLWAQGPEHYAELKKQLLDKIYKQYPEAAPVSGYAQGGVLPGYHPKSPKIQERRTLVRKLYDAMDLTQSPGLLIECPVDQCAYQTRTLDRGVIHLNDGHKWPRDAIADWVEQAAEEHGLDIAFPNPEGEEA